jgi:hypothetical protein
MEKSLIKFTPEIGPAPILSAERSPKSWAFIRNCWRSGGYLGRLKSPALTYHEKWLVSQIIEKLKSAWDSEKATTPFETARRRYITTRIFESERLYAFAEQAKAYKKFFRRKKIKSIIVGDATSSPCRLAIEAAHTLNISSNEILNGMFVCNLKYDVRCGDGRQPAKLSRLLTWGRQQEEWLDLIGSTIPFIRTGYPGIDMIASRALKHPLLPASEANVLVLPCYVTVDNIRGLNSNAYMLLVDTIEVLREIGYSNIRIKIHPGRGGVKYFQRLIETHNLNCQLEINGSVPDHLDWADFAIGPVDSGSIVEALAGGIPYFGFSPTPSNIDKNLFGNFPIFETAEDLRAALQRGCFPDVRQALKIFCHTPDSLPASPAVWQAILNPR